ncbi:MAG TPA: hypothetical protein VGM31_15540 [Puia sp.]
MHTSPAPGTFRAYSRILKLGRTIADLAESKNVELEHVAEAVSYRGLDRAVNVERKKRKQRGI